MLVLPAVDCLKASSHSTAVNIKQNLIQENNGKLRFKLNVAIY